MVNLSEIDHAVELFRYFFRVRHQEQGNAFMAADVAEEVDHLLLVCRIDIRRRLIGKEE